MSDAVLRVVIQLLLVLAFSEYFCSCFTICPQTFQHQRKSLDKENSKQSCNFKTQTWLGTSKFSSMSVSVLCKNKLFLSERVYEENSLDDESDRSTQSKTEAKGQKTTVVLKNDCNDKIVIEDSRILLRNSIAKSTGTRAKDNINNARSVGQATERLGGLVASSRPTVWTEFSRIAAAVSAKQLKQQQIDNLKGDDCNNIDSPKPSLCNLGQGFPDWAPPPFAINSLLEASQVPSHHQYTRPPGHPDLVKQLARRYSMHLNRHVDPFQNVAVTVGASQALYLSLQTLLQPGDEVIVFEPFFDLYINQIKLAGGIPVYVPLDFVPYPDEDDENINENCSSMGKGGSWTLNRTVLLQKINSQRTKAIVLNSPHNPTGKVFTRTEMEYIAESLKLAHRDCVVLSDEVYKYIVHAPPESTLQHQLESASSLSTPSSPINSSSSLHCVGHVHFASLPGMWEKTITISSAGKTFSATGWQIGWCIGPNELIGQIQSLLPYVQFCASTVMQEALARTLTIADHPYNGYNSYYDYLRNTYIHKRNLLVSALTSAGFSVPDYSRTAGGGFFIFAYVGQNVIDCIPPERIGVANAAAPGGIARLDWAICQWMAEELGLLCIPSSPFFSEERAINGASDRFIRIAFCKTDETIERAAKILNELQQQNPKNNQSQQPKYQLAPQSKHVKRISNEEILQIK